MKTIEQNKQDNFYINKPFNVFYRAVPNLDERAEYKTSKDLLNLSADSVTMLNTNNYDWCEGWTEAPFIVGVSVAGLLIVAPSTSFSS